MDAIKRVYEVREEVVVKTEEVTERFIFEFDEKGDEWIYLSPNQQKHNVNRLDIILTKLQELNKQPKPNKTE